jgi:glucose-6-phosphate isomerase
MNLDSFPAYSILTDLASAPDDLTNPLTLTPERIRTYTCKSGGFDLLYGTERINDGVLDGLQGLANEMNITEQFKSMKLGAVMNKIDGYDSENRQVLHTSCRDVFQTSPAAPEATQQTKDELGKLEGFLEELQTGELTNNEGKPFTTMIQIGIGGSDLGPRALYHALAAYGLDNRQVRFIANVDPDDGATVLKDLDLATTLVNVVSKSGTTLETLTNEAFVKQEFRKQGLDPAKHFIAVTGQGSPMDNPETYLRSFYMFDYIGGRYSATSMVGGVILGFGLGYENFEEILRGANAMDRAAEEPNIKENIPLLMALLGIWNHNFLGHETLAILPYSQGLIRFTAHLQQCDMESNGKSISRQGRPLNYQTGPVIWGEPGTNGQHAFYQLIHQGTTIIPVEFIGFRKNQYGGDIIIKKTTSQEKLNANLLAQSLALATGQHNDNPNRVFVGNRPNSILMAEQLTPYTMGALLALYEAKIVFQGFLWNINSFDQEGVQLGKILASRLLDHMAAQKENDRYDGSSTDALGWALMEATGLTKK